MRMRAWWLLLTIAVGTTSPAWAQPRAMTLVDLINVPRLSDPSLSPDGQHIVFVRSDADWKANKRIAHIWRTAADGSGLQQLTSGAEGENSPRWSPDGRSIAFIAKRGGDEHAQVYLLPVAGGEARRLTTHPTAASNPTFAPDGASIYFLADDPRTEEEIAREKAKDDIYAYDENYQQRHLWKVAVDGGATTRVTSGAFSIWSYSVARDGSKLVVHRGPSPRYGDNDRTEVWIMDASGSNAKALTDNRVTEGGAELSPDNQWVAFLADGSGTFEPYYNDKIFLVPAAGGAAKLVVPDLAYEAENLSWSKDGKSIYFTANTGVRNQVFRVDVPTGKPVALTTGDHTLGGWSYSPQADRHVFSRDEPTNAGDIWMLAGAAAPVRVTKIYDALLKDYKLPKQERVEWKGADGVTVEGLLYYPLDYQAGRRYPLVVNTHGGPAASDKFSFGSWSTYTQVLAARGYAVLKPNYRGSTGYGDPFLRDMVGHYFKNAHLDVMAGVDHLIKIGLADPDRLVKMGWSAGGHMTNKIITFTDRFKAASSGAGAANWTSMYAQSDVRSYRTPWFGGTPWQKDAPIDVYWENSPLKYVSNVKTPTIFLVGEKDVRVPLPQAVEMYRALTSLGVPTRLYVAPREPHGFGELRHQLFKANVELDWFEKHALGRTYTWEKAPGEAKKAETNQ